MIAAPSVTCPVIIGRRGPISAAHEAVARAHAGEGGVLLISGEAGIGKSRLVRATVDHARGAGFAVLQGACFEADRAQPYAPLLDLVRGVATAASPRVAAHYFASAGDALVTLFPELRTVFPDAATRAARDPEEDRRRLFHDLGSALDALAAVQPLLVVVEDVHWSDEATLDFVLHLSRRIARAPIALVLTFRSDEVGARLARLLADLDRARIASEISLRPLGEDDVSAMLQTIFGAVPAPGAAFASALFERTEGNPFFLEEMLKALLVAGDLVQGSAGWRAGPLDRVQVPRTATEAVSRRLAGLSDAACAVASAAAVAGRRFDFALMQAVTGHDEAHLLALLKELMAAQLVTEESADAFAFRHALTREAILARLLARERVALHSAIAGVLQRQLEDATHDVVEALAYHAFEAGLWNLAHVHAAHAATHALSLSAPREALLQFDRAIIATEKLGEPPDPALHLARGRAHETLGAFEQAQGDFAAALETARAAGDRGAEWGALLALGMLWAARDYERAGELRREALALARAIGEPALIARSLNRVGNWYVNREEPGAALPYHDEALQIFQQLEDPRGVAETVDLVAMAHHIAGDQETAGPFYEQSVALFSALDDRRGLSNALSVIAVCGASHHASAAAVYESALHSAILDEERPVRITVEIGWRAGEAFARAMLADCLAWRGEYGRALASAREALSIAEELQHREWQCAARRALGLVALDLFATNEALQQLERAHEIARLLGSRTWIRWTGASLATGLARTGAGGRALAVLDDVERRVPSRREERREARREERRAEPGDVSREPSRQLSRDELGTVARGSLAGGDSSGATLGTRALRLARGLALLDTGAWEEALAAIAALDAAGGDAVPCALLVRGQALAALERFDEAGVALGAVLEGAERQGARGLAWRATAAEGRLLLAQRQRAGARRAFDRARAMAESLVRKLDEPELLAGFSSGLSREAPPSPPRTRAQAAKAAHGGLTRRERDTAALIADGRSNRAIAKALGIGERTVEGYVAAALSKLGFTSRAQIAVWASERGLVPSAREGRERR